MSQRASAISLGVALVAAVGLVYELVRQYDMTAYNVAVRAERMADAARYPGEIGRFAAAYAAQREARYQDARLIYSTLERSADPALRVATLYNTGNTYLEEASGIDMKAEADRVVPLIELAKRSYREALALDPGQWDARYNLERALLLLPDAYDKKVVEVEGRQSPVRTVIGGDADSPWP